jgi:hypothetical protein
VADRAALAPILDRLLVHAVSFPARRGEDDCDRVRRWLAATGPGSELVRYLSDEAGLLAMAASRLDLSGDEELREIGRELANGADRLWTLVGTPPSDRH